MHGRGGEIGKLRLREKIKRLKEKGRKLHKNGDIGLKNAYFLGQTK